MAQQRTIKGLTDIGLTGTLSAGANETSDNVNVSQTGYFWFFVENTGSSTDLTVVLYGRPTPAGIETPIATFNLDASTTKKGSKFVEKNPSYVYVYVVNNDVGNSTTYNVQIETIRGSPCM